MERLTLEGNFDLSLALVQGAISARDLTVRKLGSSPRRLWLSANHPLLMAKSISLEDVAKEPYIALTVDDAWENALGYWSKTPYLPQVTMKTSCIEAIRTMVASGMGVSILSNMIYRHWSLDGLRIELRETKEVLPTVDPSILIPASKPLTPVSKTFVNFLQRNAGI